MKSAHVSTSGAERREVIAKSVGREIRRLRRERGMTGELLAKKIHLSQQQISRYELGVCCLTIAQLIDILSVLEVPICEFFRHVYYEPREGAQCVGEPGVFFHGAIKGQDGDNSLKKSRLIASITSINGFNIVNQFHVN